MTKQIVITVYVRNSMTKSVIMRNEVKNKTKESNLIIKKFQGSFADAQDDIDSHSEALAEESHCV